MIHASRRGISLTLIVGLNAAWLYAVMCTSLCAAGVCPNETGRAVGGHCRHERAPTSRQQVPVHEQNCLLHGHATNVFLIPAGGQAAPNLLSLAGEVLLFASLIPAVNPAVPLLDTSSHSPPGISTGRMICQKQSLLRI